MTGLVNTFARGAVVSLDKAMIKYFFPTTFGNIEVGIYAAGQRLGSLIQFFSFITAITLFPIFSNLSANGNFTRIKEIIINFENTAIVILMPIVISLAVFSLPIILFLVGAEYRASAAIMQITILGLFGIMLFQPYINFIIGGKNLILLGSLIHVIFLLTNIILNFIFIPETVFGMKMMGWCSLGAALASTASYVILGVIAKMIASKYIHVSTFKKYGYEFIFLIFISVLFIFIIDQYKLEKIIHACFGIPVFLFLFWATVYICKRDHFSKAIHNLEKIFPKSKSSIL
jgi:O-antigen/teichoic acid export membrane protein